MFSYSNFGDKFSQDSGINILMQDLDQALNAKNSDDILFLGGGNPATIKPVQEIYYQEMLKLLNNKNQWQSIFGIYDSPQGNENFREIAANYYSKKFSKRITAKNILLTNGSQSSFFVILNFLAGSTSTNKKQKVLIPLVPEYIGYANTVIESGVIQSNLPIINKVSNKAKEINRFRYEINFKAINWSDDWGLALHSRPTNPTSLMLSPQQFSLLLNKCQQNNIPLLLDQAYGSPIPNLAYANNKLVFNDNTIISMSFSKAGLPGLRTGIILANEDLIKDLTKSISVMNLATTSLGPELGSVLLQDDLFDKICHNWLKPYYLDRVNKAVQIFNQYFSKLEDVYLHECDGAFFFWLWVDREDFDSEKLYQKLKEKNCFIVPGHYFFYGLSPQQKENFNHHKQCFRINIAQSDEVLEKAIKLIVKNLY